MRDRRTRGTKPQCACLPPQTSRFGTRMQPIIVGRAGHGDSPPTSVARQRMRALAACATRFYSTAAPEAALGGCGRIALFAHALWHTTVYYRPIRVAGLCHNTISKPHLSVDRSTVFRASGQHRIPSVPRPTIPLRPDGATRGPSAAT